MKILMAASEMAPLAKTGGLADVLASLPGELQKLGHEVGVVIPYYRCIKALKNVKPAFTGVEFTVPLGWQTVSVKVLEIPAKGNEPQVFLIEQDAFFDRSALYGRPDGAYLDNAARYIFFSKAVVELARRLNPRPDILHLHDWQTALVPSLVHSAGLPFRTVLTIHNLAYQGSFWGADFGLTNLAGSYFSPAGVEFNGNLNLLKGGIMHADAITTVSDAYKRDILTPEFGCGLDGVLREQQHKLYGFLNGADYSTWNPSTDSQLPKKFRPSALAGKKACRAALLQHLNLDPDPAGPVFAMVTRLADQKGFDILLPIIDRLLSDDVRLVVLGEGDADTAAGLAVAERKYPGKFAFHAELDEPLAHLIEGGADVTLMPSRFEPCGLSAIYSLKYGTLPVAKATGGLYEIIRDEADEGWGFLFHVHSAEAFWDAIVRAKRLFRDQKTWQELMKRAMNCDYSWGRSAAAFESVYAETLRNTPSTALAS